MLPKTSAHTIVRDEIMQKTKKHKTLDKLEYLHHVHNVANGIHICQMRSLHHGKHPGPQAHASLHATPHGR